MLAVAAACTLAGAKTFREIGDQAADLPQKVLRDLGGKPHPLRRKVIAQHRIPDEATETTQVKELLENVDLDGAVVAADAVNAQRDAADYIAGPEEDGGRGSAYFLFVKGNQPKLQRVHPHPPGHLTRPKPNPRLPTAMRPRSQMTLAIPWAIGRARLPCRPP